MVCHFDNDFLRDLGWVSNSLREPCCRGRHTSRRGWYAFCLTSRYRCLIAEVPRERHRPLRIVRTGYAAISEVYI